MKMPCNNKHMVGWFLDITTIKTCKAHGCKYRNQQQFTASCNNCIVKQPTSTPIMKFSILEGIHEDNIS